MGSNDQIDTAESSDNPIGLPKQSEVVRVAKEGAVHSHIRNPDQTLQQEKTKPSGFKRLLLNLYVLAVLMALLLSIPAGPVLKELLVAIAGVLVISPVIFLFFRKKGKEIFRKTGILSKEARTEGGHASRG